MTPLKIKGNVINDTTQKLFFLIPSKYPCYISKHIDLESQQCTNGFVLVRLVTTNSRKDKKWKGKTKNKTVNRILHVYSFLT